MWSGFRVEGFHGALWVGLQASQVLGFQYQRQGCVYEVLMAAVEVRQHLLVLGSVPGGLVPSFFCRCTTGP